MYTHNHFNNLIREIDSNRFLWVVSNVQISNLRGCPAGCWKKIIKKIHAEIHNINKTPQIRHQEVLSPENSGCSALQLLSFLNGFTYSFIKIINIAI